jgi:hypothetical protein
VVEMNLANDPATAAWVIDWVLNLLDISIFVVPLKEIFTANLYLSTVA